MRKRKSPFPSIKNSSTTALIAVLIVTFWKLTEPLIPSPSAEISIPSSENPVELYANQDTDDLTKLYVDTIRSAKESIYIVIYAIKDKQIIDAIKDRSSAGIPITIVCDAQASKGVSKQFQGYPVHIVRRTVDGLTHLKILVVDNSVILLGSANFTTDSLITHGNLIIGVESPALASILEQKIRCMDEDCYGTPTLHQEFLAGSQPVELWLLPDDPHAIKRIKSLIKSAQKTIKIAMFTWTRVDLADEVINAYKRGVNVEIVIDRYSGNGASAKIVKMINKAGIPVHLSTGKGLMHHKLAIVDGKTLINGSANWTVNAFKVNDDCFVVLDQLTETQNSKLNRMWKEIIRESEPAGIK